MGFFVLFIIVIVASAQASVLRGSSADTDTCFDAFARDKMERKAFVAAIGHGTHSLYLESLR